MRVLIRTLPFLRGHYLAAVLVLVVLVLEVSAQLLIPWSLKIVVDNVLGGQPLTEPLASIIPVSMADDQTALLLFAVVAGFILTAGAHGLNVLNTYLQTLIDQGMVLRFRSALFRHVQRLSLSDHDQKRSGDAAHRINYSAQSLGQVPVMIPHILQAVITLVGMFIITFSIDPAMAMVSLLVVPPLLLAMRHYSRAVQPRLDRVLDREIESLSIVQETLSMLRVIMAFGREDHEHRRFHEHGRETADARVSVTVSQTLFSFGINTTIAAGTAIVLGFGAFQVINGTLTLGQLLVVIAYIAAVYAPLSQLVGSATPLQQYIVDLRGAFALLDSVPEVRDTPNARPIGRSQGHVRFEDVSFTHHGRSTTLSSIDFEARPGQLTAIVGPTGAGKSTLVSLLARFYDPDSGLVLLDGHDVRAATLESLRSQFSFVLQDTPLFSATVYENIAYGRLEATTGEIERAAAAAGAHEFISALPEGYDTVVGEGGRGLSGGERQRIAIARAILRDAPILILDEPTSAIDSETESGILTALDRLMDGRTSFMIAHRLSTVRGADQILVLDRGRLVERGSHETLLAAGGLYRRLVLAQSHTADSVRGGDSTRVSSIHGRASSSTVA